MIASGCGSRAFYINLGWLRLCGAIGSVAAESGPGKSCRYAKQGRMANRFKPVGVYRFESISRMEQNIFALVAV
jgi:hypothetical protein